MRVSGIRAFFAVAVAALPAPLAAQGEALSHSMQCFIATSTLTQSDDQTVKSAGLLGANFFAGQVFGASPDVDFWALLRREARFLDTARLTELLGECGAEMERRGKEIVAAAQALEAEEAAGISS